MSRVQVLLADDHPLMLDGLGAFLRSHVDIVGKVTDGRALVEAALRLKPELVILDVTMPLLNGIDAAKQIFLKLPQTKILFVTMHLSSAYIEAALTAGATGYVVKSTAREELLEAIQQVMNGRIYITSRFKGSIQNPFASQSAATGALQLTMREREILQLIAEGKMAKEIAFVLSISAKTVSFHRENIKRKVGLGTAAELTRHAVDLGLV